ncbi:MAG: N-acetyltransferase, partial [Bacteroidaceae bacterium]|nr:N-acetyltransferase [Blautia sp.]MCF0186979.1 N-acetyltransferase [Bacteroidaceae bacterium]
IDESRRYFEEGDQTTVLAMGGDEAKSNGVTEISLDTTTMGRPLYESLGFKASDECMVMEL